MKVIEYISYITIPLMILLILAFASQQKKEIYTTFLTGAREGMSVILKIFPTMIGVFVAINLFQVTGAMDILVRTISPLTGVLKVPSEMVPLGIMRSVSGGASIGLLSNVLSTYGADSKLGNIASTLLGSTETTLYVIAIYMGTVGVKKTRGVLAISLICDVIAFLISVWVWQI